MTVTLTFASLLLLVTLSPIALGQTICSCKAPDGSCNAKTECQRGCTALCGSRDACYTACGGTEADMSYARITVKLENETSDIIGASLTRASGRKIVFMPRRKAARYSIDLNNHPVWNALKFLSKRGMVLVDGTPFYKLEELRRKLLKGEKVAINFEELTVGDAVAKLSFLSGRVFRVEPEGAGKRLSISEESASLNQIVSRISAESGVKIELAQVKGSSKQRRRRSR